MPVFGLFIFVTRSIFTMIHPKRLKQWPRELRKPETIQVPQAGGWSPARRVMLSNVRWIELHNVEGHQHQANRQQSPG